MLTIQNRRLNKQYVIGGSGILDSIFQFLVRTFTIHAAKNLASSAAKEVGKTALHAGKTVAVEAGKKLVEKAINPKKKLENIISKYTGSGDSVAIQDMVRKLNGSGLKQTYFFKYKTFKK